jgi:hypothetical protein
MVVISIRLIECESLEYHTSIEEKGMPELAVYLSKQL